MQGSLLSKLIDPVYVNTVTVGPCNTTHLQRALSSRAPRGLTNDESSTKSANTFSLTTPEIRRNLKHILCRFAETILVTWLNVLFLVSSEPVIANAFRETSRLSDGCIVWFCGCDRVQVLSATRGRIVKRLQLELTRISSK